MHVVYYLPIGSYTYLRDTAFYSSRNDEASSGMQRKRRKSFGNMTEDEVMSLFLPDHLGERMDILFVSCVYENCRAVSLDRTTQKYLS